MGEPLEGAWARKYQIDVPYANALKWGTGVNPVHAIRADPGRPRNVKLDANQLMQTMASEAVPQGFIEGPPNWGYNPEDLAGLDVFASPQEAIHGVGLTNDNDHPNWEQHDYGMGGTIGDPSTGGAPGPVNPQTPINRAYIPANSSRPWGLPQKAYNRLRSIRAGQYESDSWRGISSEIPTETVNEGWINKAASGMDEGEIPDYNVMPSSYAQYERNTSMQQRHKEMDNDRAVARCADDPRTPIPSRIAPMKLKIYSEGERNYDMFPYQMDDMPRPFSYRTFGTGPETYMETNEQWTRTPLQRQPPPDPSQGIPEMELADTAQYGYSNEDQGYY